MDYVQANEGFYLLKEIPRTGEAKTWECDKLPIVAWRVDMGTAQPIIIGNEAADVSGHKPILCPDGRVTFAGSTFESVDEWLGSLTRC